MSYRGIARRCLVVFVVALAVSTLSGCYYMQAARGQLEVLNKREPIAELVDSEETPAELSRRLELVQEVRRFSVDALGLPDNDSYLSYADLERDFVVWNVFAAPEFSMQPKGWCFPVAGCVNYRGYFDEADAIEQADQLSDDGYDVAVGGIAAYSTLGRFSDPILNTMLRWQDIDLVALIFHELSHQVLYVKGDTEFNESFATAVEEAGVERWLRQRAAEDDYDLYLERRAFRDHVMQRVAQARGDLEDLYASTLDEDAMRAQKHARLQQLHADLLREYEAAGRVVPAWVNPGINNARIASMSLYHGRLDEFRELLAECENDLPCFYAAASELAQSD